MSPDIFTSSNTRPLRIRLRPDLIAQRQRYQGRDYWMLKDPLRLKYFRFEEEEFVLLQRLDGEATLEQLQQAFEKQFAPRKIKIAEIHRLLGMAHRSGILLSDGVGQGNVLIERREEESSKRRWLIFGELLHLRFRGFDPDAWLARLLKHVGWLFAWPLVLIGCSVGLSALLLVASHWEEFSRKLPAATEFFGSSNWLTLAITLAIVKILHELGHAFACKRFGGECHEMGVLLLCFTPCLYCDVSDSWMVASKWRRAAIGAAGMYVELWLASLATFLWWFSEPGLLHHLALNVMFIGSVGTLVFNANPLMRYDGYYILADLLEIPNLRQKGEAVCQRFWQRFFFGQQPKADRFLPVRQQALLASYAIAAAIYRWVVAAVIWWFLYRLTEPYGFKIAGQLLAVSSLIGLFGGPCYSCWRFFTNSGSWHTMNPTRFLQRISLAAIVVTTLFFVPLPYYVRCALRIQPQDAAGVYVDVPGQIDELFVAPGDTVQAGQPLLRLRNLELQLAVTKLATAYETERGRLMTLRHQSLTDSEASSQIAQVEKSLQAVKEELDQRRKQLSQLVITAPRAGVVMPAPRRAAPGAEESMLANWHGHPLETRNRGARLEPSDAICWIGDPQRWDAVLAVDQREIDFVRTGQFVDLLLAQRPGERIAASIVSIAEQDMKYSHASLTQHAGGELLTKTDDRGRERPLFVTYEALTNFSDSRATLATGGSGIARVHAGYLTLAARLLREARRVFHWEM